MKFSFFTHQVGEDFFLKNTSMDIKWCTLIYLEKVLWPSGLTWQDGRWVSQRGQSSPVEAYRSSLVARTSSLCASVNPWHAGILRRGQRSGGIQPCLWRRIWPPGIWLGCCTHSGLLFLNLGEIKVHGWVNKKLFTKQNLTNFQNGFWILFMGPFI